MYAAEELILCHTRKEGWSVVENVDCASEVSAGKDLRNATPTFRYNSVKGELGLNGWCSAMSAW